MPQERPTPTTALTDPNRDETVSIEIIQRKGNVVISRRVPVEYPNLLNAEANGLNILLSMAIDESMIDVILPFIDVKAVERGQESVWKLFRAAIDEQRQGQKAER